jgi:bifunctional UDP-N-acetylglucosamine pyrophosphorylase/glucosamine-1-phosphate N-acetyltransferase
MVTFCIVMAAGRGTRFRGSLSKMLLPLDGRPLVAHPVGTALRLRGCEVVAVVGHQQAAVKSALRAQFRSKPLRFVVQRVQRGTGDAVAAGLTQVRGRRGSVLILSGDVPLLSARTLGRLRRLRERRDAQVALLTMRLEDPAHYGRVIRQGRAVRGVVEYLDANPAERAVDEVNAGIYCVELGFLRREIKRLGASNAKGEVYLTDLVAAAGRRDSAVAMQCDPQELQGVNTWADLASVAQVLRRRVAAKLMEGGVHLVDPERVVIHSSVRIGAATCVGAGVELTGRTRIGIGCRVESGVILRDCHLGDEVHVKPYSVLEGVRLEPGSVVGPHAHQVAPARSSDNCD